MCSSFENFYNLNLTHQIIDDDNYIPRIEDNGTVYRE